MALNGVSRDCPKFLSTVPRIISGTGKATDFKFGGYIHRVHPNKSPLKILEKRERGHIQGLPKVLSTPYYLRNGLSNELQILYALSYNRSQQKPINNFENSSRGRSRGFAKFFNASIYRAHRAFILALARLSCYYYYYARQSSCTSEFGQYFTALIA